MKHTTPEEMVVSEDIKPKSLIGQAFTHGVRAERLRLAAALIGLSESTNEEAKRLGPIEEGWTLAGKARAMADLAAELSS